LARGDLLAAPVRSGCAAGVVAIHVLHLVPDLGAALAAGAHMLRRGGRFVTAGLDEDKWSRDDMSAIDRELSERLRTFPAPAPEAVIDAGRAAGLRLVHDGFMARQEYEETPNRSADRIEERAWSWLWDVPDDVWRREVAPVIAALRALPEPDRPRPRWNERRFIVLEAA
jgi:hypothetical protein